MARAKGIKFPLNYPLPYAVRQTRISPRDFYRKCNPIDGDKSSINKYAEENYEVECLTIFDVTFAGCYFRCAIEKKNAEEYALSLNKRHFIVAMQSSNPHLSIINTLCL